MNKFKIVFKDGNCEKCIFGYPDFDYDDVLLKIKTDRGNTVYVNRANIVFIKELTGGGHSF